MNNINKRKLNLCSLQGFISNYKVPTQTLDTF